MALNTLRSDGVEVAVIGGGTNLVVSDDGFSGAVLRFTASRLESDHERIEADAGATLQALVDFTVDRGLKGLETLAGIPGTVGAAVCGNAGAYGHSISERIEAVHFYDGQGTRSLPARECAFRYRESAFKRYRHWIILRVELVLEPSDKLALRQRADDIQRVRDEKFPATMQCAGSIFKNLLAKNLPAELVKEVPPEVVREGKIPAGYFLDQAGVKGLVRGGMRVADYHANLVYNQGHGTARELCGLIQEMKDRVRSRFGIELEEEVQYLGFPQPFQTEEAKSL